MQSIPNFTELLKGITLHHKVVCIHGKSGSGKTTLANRLKPFKQYAYYHTDDYIRYGFKESLYMLMHDLEEDIYPYKVIEGIQVPRLLRKGRQTGKFRADLIIETVCSEEARLARYQARGRNTANLAGFDRMLAQVWGEYLEYGNVPPVWRFNTDL